MFHADETEVERPLRTDECKADRTAARYEPVRGIDELLEAELAKREFVSMVEGFVLCRNDAGETSDVAPLRDREEVRIDSKGSDTQVTEGRVSFAKLRRLCENPAADRDRRQLIRVGEQLRLVRLTFSLSREELAAKLKVDVEQIIAIENGYGNREEAARILRRTYSLVTAT